MDEYGETETIFIWPKGHEEGQPYPEDFEDKWQTALANAGVEWERV